MGSTRTGPRRRPSHDPAAEAGHQAGFRGFRRAVGAPPSTSARPSQGSPSFDRPLLRRRRHVTFFLILSSLISSNSLI